MAAAPNVILPHTLQLSHPQESSWTAEERPQEGDVRLAEDPPLSSVAARRVRLFGGSVAADGRRRAERWRAFADVTAECVRDSRAILPHV